MSQEKQKVIDQLKNDPLMPMRHTAEHVLHTAMQKLYPKLKKVMGPPIENGFYFDFDLDISITPDDFEKIEAEMKKIVDADLKMTVREVSVDEAKEIFKDNKYKLETIDEIKSRGEKITLYAMGTDKDKYYDLDLCAGPHAKSTGAVKAFKLLSVAGAYYKGSEKNKMLQRIYAVAFDNKDTLEKYLSNLKEAKKRDHKKLGPELELFMFHETSPGMPYWLPKGLELYNELIRYWRREHKKYGYQEISSPILNKQALYETSGHWEHYKEDMFVADMGENEIYGVKPMNCPNAMVVFGSKPRSYRDLPLRLSDTDRLHRYERSGALNGLLRVRSFQQDDAHNYISEEQIESEYEHIFDVCSNFYSLFGLEYSFRLGTRPENKLGSDKTWDKAENALKRVLDGSGVSYIVKEGDGAFYGPKVDILMKDILGRKWQMGTIQLDFQQPARFNLKYINKEGAEKTPVVIHRVIYGSLERFIGIIIEHFGGAFPVWLAPVQAVVIPISENQVEYAQSLCNALTEENIRVEINDKNDTMQSKIRDAQLKKVPYMLIVGGREEENKNVSVRLRTGENLKALSLDDVIARIRLKIDDKALDL